MDDLKINRPGSDEQLVFIKECLPQLAAGEYKVTANLDVNTNVFKQTAAKFFVSAPRFILQQSDIYSVYPPRDSSGHYETTLPHIVFNRRTLPWERTIDGKSNSDTAFKNETGHAPWMGLLLLNEDELKGAGDAILINKMPLKNALTKEQDLFIPEISQVKGTAPALFPWDDPDSECEVIDIPLNIFKTIAPQKSELHLLAHVRKVIVDKNKESADIDDAGYFSTLIGNRLPIGDDTGAVSKRNTVFLVSLEGFHNYFNTPGYITKKKVRLVVLTSWSFTIANGNNFSGLCEKLQVGPLKMNAPDIKNEFLDKAYKYGYALLPYITRDGAATFSWYRGPFNPNFLPANSKTKIFKSADEALRFDPQTGLFDISYAAAWQLGRLLALKDKTFSTALYQWKIQSKKDILRAAAKQQINDLLPDFKPDPLTDINSLEDVMKDFLTRKYNETPRREHVPAKFSTQPEKINTQLQAISREPVTDKEPPKEVADWLGRLFLLYGVPLNYLVPHENYLVRYDKDKDNNTILAKEALGTFYIDYDWVEALLGGALSIVDARDSVVLLNMLTEGRFLPENLAANKAAAASLPTDEDKPIPLPKSIGGHITGFFLRSELVSGWKGIKIFPKNTAGAIMEAPLRIERVADDINLCIFSGKVQEIVFIQPPEGTHFGIGQRTGKGPAKKDLKLPDGNVDETTAITISFRDNDNGVIDLAKTAADMHAKKAAEGIDYSSADFAFQMLASPVMYVLKIID